jgi:Cof subfamily protein (haloacid dehalogenase superfamily)
VIRLIAFDLDGTVVNSAKKISARTLAAVERAKAEGVHIVPATGRQFDAIPDEVKNLASDYIIANNGAQLFSLPGEEKVFEQVFETEKARKLLRELREWEGMIFGAYDSVGAFDSVGKGSERGVTERIMKRNGWVNAYPVTDIEEFIIDGGRSLIKLVIIFENMEERKAAWDFFFPRKDIYVTYFSGDNIEIMNMGSNKGEALKHAAALLGVGMNSVMALGDSDNDKEMIRYAGLGIAMGNAPGEIKALADKVAPPCDEDGAARAMEEAFGWEVPV